MNAKPKYVVDAHTHVASFGARFDETSSHEDILRALRDEMTRFNVHASIIIAGFKEADPSNTSTDRLLRLTEGMENVAVVGSINAETVPDNHMTSLEAYLKAGRIRGVKLYLGYQPIRANDERLNRVYALANAYRVPVIVHTGDTLTGYVERPLLEYARPLHLDQVATDFPELPIIIAHMGNPFFDETAAIMGKHANVYADISGMIIGTRFEEKYAALMRCEIQDLLTWVGSDKLLFGTDWPLAPLKPYLEFATSLELKNGSWEDLMWRNASRLFRLGLT